MSHYSKFHMPSVLAPWARRVSAKLKEEFPKGGFAICFRGMSGSVAATALMLACKRRGIKEFAMCYVRKDNEQTHGEAIEKGIVDCPDQTIFHLTKWAGVFVDDFVCTGTTFRAVRAATSNWVDWSRGIACQSHEVYDDWQEINVT